MRKIKELADNICEELEGAKCYAEKYIELKVNGDSSWAGKFKIMANDELTHAMNLHEYAVGEINKLKAVYTPPQDMLDKWDKVHAEYVEKAAWIKQMLTM